MTVSIPSQGEWSKRFDLQPVLDVITHSRQPTFSEWQIGVPVALSMDDETEARTIWAVSNLGAR